MGEEFSQADLDALLGDLGSFSAETKAETKEPDKSDPLSGDENLSQDQIDELIKQFLG